MQNECCHRTRLSKTQLSIERLKEKEENDFWFFLKVSFFWNHFFEKLLNTKFTIVSESITGTRFWNTAKRQWNVMCKKRANLLNSLWLKLYLKLIGFQIFAFVDNFCQTLCHEIFFLEIAITCMDSWLPVLSFKFFKMWLYLLFEELQRNKKRYDITKNQSKIFIDWNPQFFQIFAFVDHFCQTLCSRKKLFWRSP